MKAKETIPLAEHISENLLFRDTADDLFAYIRNLKEPKITLDFSRVIFMSAAFAHQYLANKKATEKDISEANRSSDIIQMFEVIERRRQGKRTGNDN